MALGFLSRIPVPTVQADAGAMARSTRLFGGVGLMLGILAALAANLAAVLWGTPGGALVGVGVGMLLSGGLHLDGLADCLDGWLVNGGAERRIEVMHDPRIGALSAAFLFLFLLFKIYFLYRCLEAGLGLWALPLAALWGRAPLAWELWSGPPAMPGKGLYAGLHSQINAVDVGLSLFLGLIGTLPFVAVLPLWSLGLGVAGAMVGSALWHRSWRQRIGGLSGDVLGAAVELRELWVLAIFASLELPG